MTDSYLQHNHTGRLTPSQAILTFITITAILSGMLYPVVARLHDDTRGLRLKVHLVGDR